MKSFYVCICIKRNHFKAKVVHCTSDPWLWVSQVLYIFPSSSSPNVKWDLGFSSQVSKCAEISSKLEGKDEKRDKVVEDYNERKMRKGEF
ncbi:hypothetical protein K2173_026526 [Erythroxylum novogranatense]|uniref:Uncharacterized protein n=1 Tax=Erythroxylum novogranatense TaxID=1862640 RepID=A0AAV8TZ67_9ROSI|nr:hypothetical protein K2173_026526 [Erythroxylum novogranatense]